MLAIALRANYKPETDPGNRVCLAQISTGVKFASSYLQRVLGCVPQAAHPGPVFGDLLASQERVARRRVESLPLMLREVQVEIGEVLQPRARSIHCSGAAQKLGRTNCYECDCFSAFKRYCNTVAINDSV